MSGGTPPTTPRFGAPRYSDATDPAAFAADVNAISDAFDHAVKLTQTVKTGAYTAVDGDAVIVGSGAASAVTITLPAHAANQIVSVANFSTFGTTVAGTSIQGKGLNNASSFPLGTVGAKALLFDDGTHWYLLAGEQDSGWMALPTLWSAWSPATGYYAPSARKRGDEVEIRGSATTSGTTPRNSIVGTVPSGFAPASKALVSIETDQNSGVPAAGIVDTSGNITIVTNALSYSSGTQFFLGGSYPLTT